MFGDKEGGGFFDRLKKGLSKTRESLTRNFDQIIFGEKVIDQKLFDELEETFISADFGPAFTYDLIEEMKQRVKRDQLNNPEVLKSILKENIKGILAGAESSANPEKAPGDKKLHTIMVVGVNGTGKTTTIGKLANNFKARGIPVALAAADTFRAAAIEQLEIWSKRVGSPIFKQKMGSDPSAVVFDAVKGAPSQGAKVLIIDTAGRLHTKVNLMEELKKMKRIMGRELPGSPDEILLVLDATTGQNALNQAKMFKDEIGVTGIVLTKLDGTAKGGILIRIAKELQIPIQYIGIGEKIDDLRPFNREEFVNALFESYDR
jgi:fused signal recognition particle receptor